jgi:uncharacterized protein YodC (DUF2158 family)
MADRQNRASEPRPADPARPISNTQASEPDTGGLLEIGAPVRSKSDGPVMLVDDVITSPGYVRYRCVWVEKGRGLRFADFQLDELVPIAPDGS